MTKHPAIKTGLSHAVAIVLAVLIVSTCFYRIYLPTCVGAVWIRSGFVAFEHLNGTVLPPPTSSDDATFRSKPPSMSIRTALPWYGLVSPYTYSLSIPLWIPGMLLALGVRCGVRRQRDDPLVCGTCRYPRCPSTACPECGQQYDVSR